MYIYTHIHIYVCEHSCEHQLRKCLRHCLRFAYARASFAYSQRLRWHTLTRVRRQVYVSNIIFVCIWIHVCIYVYDYRCRCYTLREAANPFHTHTFSSIILSWLELLGWLSFAFHAANVVFSFRRQHAKDTGWNLLVQYLCSPLNIFPKMDVS